MRLLLMLLLLLGLSAGHADAANAKRSSRIESLRRQLPKGRGTFQRSGMVGELESLAAASGETGGTQAGWYQTLAEMLTLQVRGTSMFFVSDNIFNTQEDRDRDTQFAHFVGASLDAQFTESWFLSNSFDQAWFYYGKAANADQDFITSTVRQTLSYERSFWNKKLELSVPLSWELSRLFNRATGARALDTWTYGTGLDLSWLCAPWIVPAFGYQYFYMDSGSPSDAVPDKHKHNLNLGLSLIPFKGHKFYITPSLQYSVEQFIGIERTDKLWTPALTVSWLPLKYLAVDVNGSYTSSKSSVQDAGYQVFNGTVFMRLFFDW